jgi:hypothetical protein
MCPSDSIDGVMESLTGLLGKLVPEATPVPETPVSVSDVIAPSGAEVAALKTNGKAAKPAVPPVPAEEDPATDMSLGDIVTRFRSLEEAAKRIRGRRLAIKAVQEERKALQKQIAQLQLKLDQVDEKELQLISQDDADTEAKTAMEAMKALRGFFTGMSAELDPQSP